MPALVVPLLLLLGLTLLHVRHGINLVDEGFLWYGTQRAAAGEFPVAEFQSLDPGRYLWTALWMRLLDDDGIIVMRGAAALFEAMAVAAISLISWRQTRSLLLSLLAGVICVLWICPWQGRYEASMSLIEVAAFSLLAARADDFRFFLCGLVLGIAWMFGRHLGLYGSFAFLVVVLALRLADRQVLSRRRAGLAFGGFLAGYWPMPAAELLVRGFARSSWGEYVRWLGQGATNISLAVPWPWRLTYGDGPLRVDLAEFFYGSFFLILPLFGLCVLAWWFLRRRGLLAEQPMLFAASVVSIPYAHGALARPDLEHLLRYGTPAVLAITLICASARPIARAVPGVLLGGVLVLMLHLDWETPWTPCRDVLVGRDVLCLGRDEAQVIEGGRKLVQRHVRPGESVLVIPYHVGLYPALGLVAPTWETFGYAPRSEAFENAEIERIEKARTSAVFAYVLPIDGRPEYAYAVTHPRTTRYLQENFELVPQDELPPTFGFLVRRRPGPAG